MFNKKNYFISLAENTPIGTPLPIEMNVRDPDVVNIPTFVMSLKETSGNLNFNIICRVKIRCLRYDWKMCLAFLTLNQSW